MSQDRPLFGLVLSPESRTESRRGSTASSVHGNTVPKIKLDHKLEKDQMLPLITFTATKVFQSRNA